MLTVLFALWASVPVAAADPATELRQVQDELAEVERAIRAARTEESSVGQSVIEAQAALSQALDWYDQAQSRVDESIAQVALTETMVTSLRGQVMTLESALARTGVDLRNTQKRLEETAVDLYMSAAAMPGMEVFGQDSAAEAVTAVAYSSAIFDRDDDVFDAYQLLEREEERQRSQVDLTRLQTESELQRLRLQKDNLELERDAAGAALALAEVKAAEVETLLSSIQRDIAAAEEHKEGLEADAAALEDEIDRLARTDGIAPSVLSWPIPGLVSSPYGYRIHPILGVRKLHTGIDINGSTGEPIAAAGGGTVILAQVYGGYGRAVVIDHGGGLTSLYAHMSGFGVSVGEEVDRGDLVGYVGCSGSCTGPHLHFEVRVNGAPVDPLDYLR